MSPRTPLLDPAAYFSRRDRPSLRSAAGIVTVSAVLSIALVWWFVDRVISRIDVAGAVRQEAMSELGGQFLLTFLGVYFGWLLLAVVIHFFMWFAGADRWFGATLAVVGEAMLVSVALLPLSAIGFYVVLGQVPAEPDAAIDFVEQFNRGSTGLLVVEFLRVLWEAAVQAIGLAIVHDISLSKTAIVTFGIGFLLFLV
ncbi:YIP1 family protein [Halorhabdus salina]|uniref:YIP1 family protein n=1 Tax=Halorhabdus salina TaxID=2750670 RepID=UPI0015EF3B75|nr:YIP1 family protein [Halorhabdus salina]